MTTPRSCLLLALCLLTGSAASAQRPPRVTPVAVPVPLRTLEFTATSLAWVNDSSIALIDSDAKQLVIAGIPGGTFRRIGRQGAGPGEFRVPTFLLARDGELIVDDIGARRVSRFDAEGKFIGSTPTPGATLRLLALDGDRLRLAWIEFAPSGGGPTVSDLDLGSGSSVARFRVFAHDSALAVTSGSMPGPNPFLALAAGPGGEILAGSSQVYRITVFDSTGRVLRSLGRKLPPAFRTDAEIDEIVARRGRAVRAMAAAERASDDLVARLRSTLKKEPKPHFSMGGIAADSDGRVWVATSRGGDRTEVDVFGADGRFLGTVLLRGRVEALALRLPWLAALSEWTEGGDEGLQGIDLYRVGAGR